MKLTKPDIQKKKKKNTAANCFSLYSCQNLLHNIKQHWAIKSTKMKPSVEYLSSHLKKQGTTTAQGGRGASLPIVI